MIFHTDPGSEIEIPSFFFRSWFGIGKVGSGNRDKYPESVIKHPGSEFGKHWPSTKEKILRGFS